jgi:hypothetical protein
MASGIAPPDMIDEFFYFDIFKYIVFFHGTKIVINNKKS